jgi:single-strand DNA-binding protein
MKNTVTLVGFVGNTPEVRTTQTGASIKPGGSIEVVEGMDFTVTGTGQS